MGGRWTYILFCINRSYVQGLSAPLDLISCYGYLIVICYRHLLNLWFLLKKCVYLTDVSANAVECDLRRCESKNAMMARFYDNSTCYYSEEQKEEEENNLKGRNGKEKKCSTTRRLDVMKTRRSNYDLTISICQDFHSVVSR